MKRNDFDLAVTAARKAARETQIELARDLIRDFQQDMASFDPKRLMSLDDEGIAEVLRMLDAGDAIRPIATAAAEHARRASAGTGWAELRRPERGCWLRGVIIGAATGGGIIIFIGLAGLLLG